MRRLVALAGLALALAACEARVEMNVHDDGSGTFGMTMLVDKPTLDAMRAFGGGVFDEMRKDLADDPVEWTVTNVKEGAQSGVHAVFAFADIEDLKAKLTKLDEEDSDQPFGEFVVERAGDGWRFEATANTPTASDLAPSLPGPGQNAPPGFEQASPFAGLGSQLNLRFVFRVTLPGGAGETNASRIERAGSETTFVWQYDTKKASTTRSLFARTTAATGGGFPALPVAAVVGVLLAGGVLTVVRRRPIGPPVFEGFPVPLDPPPLHGDSSETVEEAPVN